jgi:hypothetical protein
MVIQTYGPYVKYRELGNEMGHWRQADSGETMVPRDALPAA